MDDFVWETCSTCWGQKNIWELARNGEGYIPTPCNTCIGVGSTIELKEFA